MMTLTDDMDTARRLRDEATERVAEYDAALEAVVKALGTDARPLRDLFAAREPHARALADADASIALIEGTAWPTEAELIAAFERVHTTKQHTVAEGGRVSLTRHIHPKRSRPLVVIETTRPFVFDETLRERILDIARREQFGGARPGFEHGVETWNGGPGSNTMSVVLGEPHGWPTDCGIDAP